MASDVLHALTIPLAGRPMTVIEQVTDSVTSPAFLASEVGAALGYPGKSFQLRLADWSEHLRPGKDVLKVEGEELAALKAAGAVGKNARSVLLLTESGLHLVLMLSSKPTAIRFQHWLADEVLPAIRRTGRYEPNDPRALAAHHLGRYALHVANEGYHYERLANAARIVRAVLAGATTTTSIALLAKMKPRNCAFVLRELERRGLLVEASTRHDDFENWALTPIDTTAPRQIEARS